MYLSIFLQRVEMSDAFFVLRWLARLAVKVCDTFLCFLFFHAFVGFVFHTHLMSCFLG